MICNLGSVSLIVSGTIAGSITLNPIILGSISGSGILLQTFSETKTYKRKIEMCRFAYQSYLQLMTDLHNHLRGINFNEKELLNKCSIIDGIIDLCPIVDKYEKQYNKNSKFNQQTKLIPIFLIIMQSLFGFSNWYIKIKIPFFKKLVDYKFN